MKNFVLTLVFISVCSFAYSQNTRLEDHNSIGWYQLNTNVTLAKDWTFVGEFHLRRTDIVSDPQQTLFKLAINHSLGTGLNVRAGYANAETFSYGTYPLNGMGKQFTEHRAYQMVSLANKTGIVENTHRLMLEQRWVGRYSDASLEDEDQFPFTNRLRYMYRLQIPLKGRETVDKTPYIAVYDEILIGFGKNVGENVFDQNRIGAVIGYRFSPAFRLEGGFINQTAQLGREIGGRNVFQYNNGLIINGNISF